MVEGRRVARANDNGVQVLFRSGVRKLVLKLLHFWGVTEGL